jgi:Flp pilus assembly protein TadG
MGAIWRAKLARLRDERGVSLVEFALVATIFFTLVFGILDLGRAAYQYNIVANSAREGARLAIIQSNTNAQVQSRVIASSANFITAGDITITRSTCTSIPCGTTTVSVRHVFTPITPLIRGIVGNSLALSASSTMVVER